MFRLLILNLQFSYQNDLVCGLELIQLLRKDVLLCRSTHTSGKTTSEVNYLIADPKKFSRLFALFNKAVFTSGRRLAEPSSPKTSTVAPSGTIVWKCRYFQNNYFTEMTITEASKLQLFHAHNICQMESNDFLKLLQTIAGRKSSQHTTRIFSCKHEIKNV